MFFQWIFSSGVSSKIAIHCLDTRAACRNQGKLSPNKVIRWPPFFRQIFAGWDGETRSIPLGCFFNTVGMQIFTLSTGHQLDDDVTLLNISHCPAQRHNAPLLHKERTLHFEMPTVMQDEGKKGTFELSCRRGKSKERLIK